MNFAELSHKAIELSKITNNTILIKENKLPKDYDINENRELKKTYEYLKQNVQVIFLTGGAGTGKSTFIKYLKNNLDNYKRPRDIEFRNELPKNSMRKILKRELRKEAILKFKEEEASKAAAKAAKETTLKA